MLRSGFSIKIVLDLFDDFGKILYKKLFIVEIVDGKYIYFFSL